MIFRETVLASSNVFSGSCCCFSKLIIYDLFGCFLGQILKTLHKTYSNMKMKPIWTDINPKAVTTDELFGFLHPATREWKDGMFGGVYVYGSVVWFEVHLCRQLSAVVRLCLCAIVSLYF